MMSEHKNTILFTVQDGVVRVTLNRPDKRNALNDELVSALKDALKRVDFDENARVVILAGAGADFCSGADLSALQKISTASVEDNLEDARSLMELFMLIRKLRVPVIAAVRGRALAGGCGLALACDIVLAARSARFGFPEVKIGFVPAMVMAILRRNVTEKRAFELLSLGNEITAEEAERLGLVNRVFAEEEFDIEFERYARAFTKLGKSSVALTKKLLYQIDGLSLPEALASGADVNVIARLTPDCQKSIARFLRKE